MSNALRLALPKGRVLKTLVDQLTALGLRFEEHLLESRRLVIPAINGLARLGFGLEVFIVKNADVPVYVEHGVADIGVAGTDVLFESGAVVFRPHTFAFGRCRVVLAAPGELSLDALRAKSLPHIATKYVRFADQYFRRIGWPVELIPLSGSVELAPQLGLADAIVDLTETGNTLRENGLIPLQELGETSVKLIANCALTRPCILRVEALIEALAAIEEAA